MWDYGAWIYYDYSDLAVILWLVLFCLNHEFFSIQINSVKSMRQILSAGKKHIITQHI